MWFRKHHLDKHSLTYWTFAVTLTLNAVIPFFHRTLWLMVLYYQTKFGCKLTCSLEDTTEIVIVLLYKPLPLPWHWTQWTNFSAWHSGLWCCITIPRFGNEMFCGSEDIVWTNIHWHFEPSLLPWPWRQQSHFSKGHSSLWCCTIKPSLVANGPAV